MTSYRVAILWTDGLTTGWTADYADREAAVDDLRRYAARAGSERRILTAAICPTGTHNAETIEIEQPRP